MSIYAYLVLTTTHATLSLATTSIPDTMWGMDAALPIHGDGVIIVVATLAVAVDMNTIILCMFLVSSFFVILGIVHL